MHDEYLTTTQAAKLLKVSRFSVLNWVKQGKLQSIATHGGHQRIPKKTIMDFLQKSGIKTSDPEIVECPSYPILNKACSNENKEKINKPRLLNKGFYILGKCYAKIKRRHQKEK